jgi:hypothetical protein
VARLNRAFAQKELVFVGDHGTHDNFRIAVMNVAAVAADEPFE